jgi:5-methylcytosine-specific restriction endonuclease McrA
LVFLEKAEMVSQSSDGVLRTVTRQYAMPAVVRLMHYVHAPFRGVMLTRQNIFKRDRHKCQYCGTKKDLTLDHMIPRSKGGKSTWNNLVTACKRCNARKGDSTPEQAGMHPEIRPYRPTYIMYLSDFSGYVCEEWKPFLPAPKSAVA